jgi:hypothetical protein
MGKQIPSLIPCLFANRELRVCKSMTDSEHEFRAREQKRKHRHASSRVNDDELGSKRCKEHRVIEGIACHEDRQLQQSHSYGMLFSALVTLVLSFISMLSVVPVLLLLLASHKIASDCRLLASESC